MVAGVKVARWAKERVTTAVPVEEEDLAAAERAAERAAETAAAVTRDWAEVETWAVVAGTPEEGVVDTRWVGTEGG